MIPKTSHILFKRRIVWKSKRILNRLYHKWYHIIQSAIKPGTTLEIGGGSGNFKEYFPGAISSDILFAKWLDAVLDAHHLPFGDETFDNIILFDVLHHLQDPGFFFGCGKGAETRWTNYNDGAQYFIGVFHRLPLLPFRRNVMAYRSV